MGFPFPIQTQYTGMQQDSSRDQLPPGSVWNLQDYFPNALGAPLRKRGGWTYTSPLLNATGSVRHVIYAEFSAGAKLLATDGATGVGAALWTIATSAVTAVSAGTANFGRPVFHADKVIFPKPDGSGQITYYDGAAVGAITAAPSGKYATVYKDRTILAGTAAQPRYVYFSAASDPMTWDTTNGWISVSHVITGVAALRNMVLVFSSDRTERIRGTTPPPSTDMVLEKLSDYGCVDNRSIAYWGDAVLYADTMGVYMTDGSSTVDLTAAGGIQNYWRTQMAGFVSGIDATAWILTGGVYRNYYFTVLDNTTSFVDCLVCDLTTRSWLRMKNFPFRTFASAHGIFEDLYAGMFTSARVVRITDVFSPAASNKNDADGTAVTPIVEYPMARGFIRVRRRWFPSLGITNWRRMYLSYDLRDAAADNPVLRMSYVQTPEATAYTAMVPDIAETTKETRVARSFGISGERGGKTNSSMIGIKVAQVNASSDTRIYGLEGLYQTQGVGKLAQK